MNGNRQAWLGALVAIAMICVSFAVPGCGLKSRQTIGGDGEKEHGHLLVKSPNLLSFIRSWAQVAGREMHFSRLTITDNPFAESDGLLSFETRIGFLGVEQYSQLFARLAGVADETTGQITELSLSGNAWGPSVTLEKIRFLRPYAEILVKAMDKSLSGEECSDVLDKLGLSAERLDQLERVRNSADERPRVEKNGIRYWLHFSGSEEGGTPVITATIIQKTP